MHLLILLTTVVFAIIAFFLSIQTASGKNLEVPGRNNTVLFVTGAASGLTNVHIAASYGLQEYAPHITVHYASFPAREKDISRVSSIAMQKYPATRPIIWHGLPGPDYLAAVYQHIGNISGMIFAPGLKGINRLVSGMSFHLDPWGRHDYIKLYQHIRNLIEEVDPAVIVLDSSLRPALDASLDAKRRFVFLSPNALVDVVAMAQPWGKALWKYPAQGSGISYPIPWTKVPLNVYLHLRFIAAYLFDQDAKATRSYYGSQGVQNNQHFLTIKDVPWMTMTIPEAGLPLVLPKEVTECGPIVLDIVKVEDVSQELDRWIKKAPTVLINLGSMMKYDEVRARIMADTIHLVLESSHVQVLWKFTKLGNFSDDFLKPLEQYAESNRFRHSSWLEVEPISLLQSGHIVLSVHHGGANCFHEAIYSGVPQVTLPLWYDCYNYAQLVEYLKVGIWPAKDTAPTWEASLLSQGILRALNEPAFIRNPRRIAEAARRYNGRKGAAEVISDMANRRHSSTTG